MTTSRPDEYQEIEPEYGEMKARIRWWSPDVDETQYTYLETRPCTKVELGIGPEGTQE